MLGVQKTVVVAGSSSLAGVSAWLVSFAQAASPIVALISGVLGVVAAAYGIVFVMTKIKREKLETKLLLKKLEERID